MSDNEVSMQSVRSDDSDSSIDALDMDERIPSRIVSDSSSKDSSESVELIQNVCY